MKKLYSIVEKIAFDALKEPGTIVQAIDYTGRIEPGRVLTVENGSFPWIRFQEIGDGYNPLMFRKLEDK